MLLHWLGNCARRSWVYGLGTVASPQPRRRKLTLELLEDRTLLSTLTVTNPMDSGPGSHRYEIAQAASGDTINFDSSLQGQTIHLTSGQLSIAKNLTIAGLGASQAKLAVLSKLSLIEKIWRPDSQRPSFPYFRGAS